MKISELFPEVVTEDSEYEFKALLKQDNPVKWAKTIVGYANDKGGTIFVGVSNDGEAFGLGLNEIDQTKNLVARVNDRNIFPHARISYVMRSIDESADHFVLGIKVMPAESVVRYREGDFSETVYIRGNGNSTPTTPEDIISLSKRRSGVDNETTDVEYRAEEWKNYLNLCKEYRSDSKEPSLKELQNEEIVSKEGFAKSGFVMFSDQYDRDDTLICCRLWSGNDKTGTVIDSARIKGSIAVVFENALGFIERNTKRGWRKTEKGGREEIRAYPREAIREALVNAIAHRDYSITGTQIDIDIYKDRIEIVSPGSWLLPKGYAEYPVGSIPSIRRNSIIAACLDVANLMERGGTGFQTMMQAYSGYEDALKPVVSIYFGFLNLKLYDALNQTQVDSQNNKPTAISDKVISLLSSNGPMKVKDLQKAFSYSNRTRFLKEVINPLIAESLIYRDGSAKSPTAVFRLVDHSSVEREKCNNVQSK